jgi:hypothetical protein
VAPRERTGSSSPAAGVPRSHRPSTSNRSCVRSPERVVARTVARPGSAPSGTRSLTSKARRRSAATVASLHVFPSCPKSMRTACAGPVLPQSTEKPSPLRRAPESSSSRSPCCHPRSGRRGAQATPPAAPLPRPRARERRGPSNPPPQPAARGSRAGRSPCGGSWPHWRRSRADRAEKGCLAGKSRGAVSFHERLQGRVLDLGRVTRHQEVGGANATAWCTRTNRS